MNKTLFFVILIFTIGCITGCSVKESVKGNREVLFPKVQKTNISKAILLPEEVENSGNFIQDNFRQTSNFSLRKTPSIAWRIPSLLNKVLNSPIIYKNSIFLLDESGMVKKISLTSHEEVWSLSLRSRKEKDSKIISGGLSIDSDGNLYVTNSLGDFISIDSDLGRVKWRFNFNTPLISAATVVEDGVVILDADGGTRFFSKDGLENWNIFAPGKDTIYSRVGSPVVSNDILLLPSSNGSLKAVNLKTGRELWNFNFDSQRKGIARSTFNSFTGNPTIANGNIFLGTVNGEFTSLTSTGDVNWKTMVGLRGSPLVVSNSVFFVSDLYELVRLEASSGSLIWATSLPNFSRSHHFFSPLMAGSKLWLTGDNSHLISFDVTTGDLIDKYDIKAISGGAPLYYSKSLILYTRSGELVAIK